MKILFLEFLFLKKDWPSPPHRFKYVPKGIPNNSKSVCNALLKSSAFHIQASCSPDTALGYRIRVLWFITEVLKIRQSNYWLDSPQCLQSAKFKKCKILTGSDKYIMRELLKCKLPAFWYSCGACTGPQSLHPSSSALVRRKKGNGAGENEQAELSQASWMGPHSMGEPQRKTRTAWEWEALQGQAAHCTHTGPQTVPEFQKGPGVEGSPTRTVQCHIYTSILGKHPEVKLFASWWNLISKCIKGSA